MDTPTLTLATAPGVEVNSISLCSITGTLNLSLGVRTVKVVWLNQLEVCFTSTNDSNYVPNS